jgi:argininosuccinate synthase
MKERIVLAYSGSIASSAAVAWLLERHGADVITLTVDIGQSEDLEELRARALACGALRAHVIDAREPFARDYILGPLRAGATSMDIATLADPLIARLLAELASIERAGAVAHAAPDDRAGFERSLAAHAPALRLLRPVRDSGMDTAGLLAYARARHLPGFVDRREPHLLVRPSADPARAPRAEAHLDIAFAQGVPVSLNGVRMPLDELIESLSLIAGQYGIGFGDHPPAPAASVLRATYAAGEDGDDLVRVTLRPGTYSIQNGPEVAFTAPSSPLERLAMAAVPEK